MANDSTTLTAAEIVSQIKEKRMSAVEVTEAHLEHSEKIGKVMNSWIKLDPEGALKAAREVDAAIARGEDPGPMAGAPIGLKDLIDMEGLPTTAGSIIDNHTVADSDALLARKIRQAGGVILGKLNLHEFAFGPTGHNPHYGDQKNPWDTERVTGGSSGGSGNSVATGQVSIAIGSDTGGSIRIPASLCGVIGHKPTHGLVTKSNCAPLSWSLDSFGPLARSARDCALMMSAIAGHDPDDASSIACDPPDFMGALDKPIEEFRIGHAREYYEQRSEPPVAEAVNNLARVVQELGAKVVEVEIPDVETAFHAAAVVMVSEAAAVHENNIRDNAQNFDPAVLERIRPGFFIPATSYIQALRFREQWTKRICREVYGEVDLVLSAATPIPAALRSQSSGMVRGKEVEIRTLMISLTRLWNFLGGPSTAFPSGMSEEGLPLGAQIMGAPFSDHHTLAFVHQLEKNGVVKVEKPPL
ncbi:MAG: amidase [Nitrospinae bacterium]|nr:amidase [Nitrospinota bacterium]